MASPVTGLDFVAVPSTDWLRSRAFYVDTLGLRPDANGKGEFWIGATCFGIYEPATFGSEFAPQKHAHIAMHVDDIEAARAELEAKGIEFQGETFDTGVCLHGVLRGSRRQRPDAPSPLRTRGAQRRVITVERTDFVSVPVTDMARSKQLLRRDPRPPARRGRRHLARVPPR